MLVKPCGWHRKISKADNRAWVRRSANRSPGMRAPVAVVTVPVIAARASVPVIGS